MSACSFYQDKSTNNYFIAANQRMIAALALLYFTACVVHGNDSEFEMIRLIVLGRHGNRAPNPQVPALCPNFIPTIKKWGVPLAALSPVGKCENAENGRFLRKHYGWFLPEVFTDNTTINFFSERMSRNIQSTRLTADAMFPSDSTAMVSNETDLVPIATTQAGLDRLMNCPRDGPCRARYHQDFISWCNHNCARIFAEHRHLYHRISRACGANLTAQGFMYGNTQKNLAWASKAINDAFQFAINEGIDPTMHGRISHEDLVAFKNIVSHLVKGTRFGKGHQLTYWVSEFLPTVLAGLAKPPPNIDEPRGRFHRTWRDQKFWFFLNHRELLYSIAHMLGLPIELPGFSPDTLPPGCSLQFEVYQNKVSKEVFLNMSWWAPTAANFEDKKRIREAGGNLMDLYRYGTMVPVAPRGCVAGRLCPLDRVYYLWKTFTEQTGSWKQVCYVTTTQRNPVIAFDEGPEKGGVDDFVVKGFDPLDRDIPDLDVVLDTLPEMADASVHRAAGGSWFGALLLFSMGVGGGMAIMSSPGKLLRARLGGYQPLE
eukprot:g26889.t1